MRVLVLNAGSSSIKYQVLDVPGGTSVLAGSLQDIGSGGPSDHAGALTEILGIVDDDLSLGPGDIDAIGHRVVHGGERFTSPTLITEEVESHIDSLSRLAPLHNPANVQGIRAARAAFPDVPHVAVFDTAFHHTMPQHASTVALPRDVSEQLGIKKYGFHGTSHSYVSRVASEMLGGDPSEHRIITAHLGNGSSIAAIRSGMCLDTSMGFTPLQGLVMGTRAGDLDPAIVTHLMSAGGMSVEEVEELLNTQSGLLGLAGTSDFRDITQRATAGEPTAVLALQVWAWRMRHYIGAYLALLGGLDALVFTGGIGENSSLGRERATEGLEFLGITVDRYLNGHSKNHPRFISPAGADVAVMVIPTNEELEIATQVHDVLAQAR
jgi:acetate kinase